MAINIPAEDSALAICPACGYPTWGSGLCAPCAPTVADTIEVAADVSDFNPAA